MEKNYLWELDPFFLFLYLLLPLILILLLFISSKSWSKSQLNLPPSLPSFPIIGNLHQLAKDPYRSLRSLCNKYGPLMLLNLGQVPTLVVSSPDLVREIIDTNNVVFSSRPKTTANIPLPSFNCCLDFFIQFSCFYIFFSSFASENITEFEVVQVFI